MDIKHKQVLSGGGEAKEETMRHFIMVLAILMCASSSTRVLATSAEEDMRKRKGASLPQTMTEVLRDDPHPVATGRQYLWSDGSWWKNSEYNDYGDVFPPDYSDGSRDFMMTAYRMLFKSHPEADWPEMVNYMWWTAAWKKQGSEFGPYATEFARKEGVTPDHAQAFWSWRQELLSQARTIMNDPTAIRALYKEYKILLTTAAGWGARRDGALDRMDMILAIIRGTHELCPELMIAWSSKLRDSAYNHNRYYNTDFARSVEKEEATEWFYFLERRRSVGGDELMKAYEEILVDFIQSVAYNEFKY